MRKVLTVVLIALVVASLSTQGILAAKKEKGKTDSNEVVFSTVVKDNGHLQVKNGQLCNEKGEPIQLKGMSTHGLQFCNFGKNTLKYLVRDWKITVIRAVLYTGQNGYIGHPELKERLTAIVDQAIRYGIYVVIDWHVIEERDPNIYKNEAKVFFEEMATTYGKYPNVIYEICNEPNSGKTIDVTWQGQIKPYAETVIPAIRAIAPNNIIIVGTDTWSQGVDRAADDPLNYPNIMYTLHFYAGTHKQWLRDKADYALSKGAALFVTEWGTTNSNGAGRLYLDEAQTWLDWMKQHKISWCNWNFSNYFDDTAALNTTVGMNGPWKDSQLTESGEWIKSKLLEK
ncbi:MAG TPA: glycoside hydrolase family 5 protein [Bacillota bacterium]|nr:glycoside hydrolase family 5 protein [Bacillota bacterium]